MLIRTTLENIMLGKKSKTQKTMDYMSHFI